MHHDSLPSKLLICPKWWEGWGEELKNLWLQLALALPDTLHTRNLTTTSSLFLWCKICHLHHPFHGHSGSETNDSPVVSLFDAATRVVILSTRWSPNLVHHHLQNQLIGVTEQKEEQDHPIVDLRPSPSENFSSSISPSFINLNNSSFEQFINWN